MAKTSLLGTGLSGLVGSKFVADFGDKYEFDRMDISSQTNPVDITDKEQVKQVFAESEAKFVLHLAAFTNVSAAWEQRDDKSGLAYQVNVEGTRNIVEACREFDKHLIHISTAYVFDGEKSGLYTEEDQVNPIEWYGQTKLLAEEIVKAGEIDWTILRIDQPFRSDDFPRLDIVHRIIRGLQEGNLYPQFTNHYFGPTFIDDFAKVIDWVVRTGQKGLFHASSGEQWSDYEFSQMVKQVMKLGGEVKPGNLDEYLQTLKRPYQRNTAMSCDKLKEKLDFELSSVKKAASMIK